VTISNCSNNYGPFQLPEKLIPLIIMNILHGLHLPIYGDGHNVRDWLHVADHCRAIDLILHKGTPGECYNIGGDSESENLALVELLCEIADEAFREQHSLRARYSRCPAALTVRTSTLITFVPDRPGHDRRYAVNCEKISRELHFDKSVSLERGLRDTFNWYLQNDWWWQRIMDATYQEWVRSHYRADVASSSSLNAHSGQG